MTKTEPAPDRRIPVKPRSFNARFNAGLTTLLAKLKVDDVPHIKRIIITVVGGTVLILGAAMVFLPGPGALVMLGGLAVLGTEYAWARRWMRKGKLLAHKALSKTQQIFTSKDKLEPVPVAASTCQAAVTPIVPPGSEPLSDEVVPLVR